jgi:hypothetical protein
VLCLFTSPVFYMRYKNDHILCPSCGKAGIDMQAPLVCIYCHKEQETFKSLTEPCEHCRRVQKTVSYMYCNEEFII